MNMDDVHVNKNLLEQRLKLATEKLNAANNANQALLETLSHDLRTPLNNIIGFASMMEQEIFGPVEVRQYREYIQAVYESGREMLQTMDDVLSLEQFENVTSNSKDFRHIIDLAPDLICICEGDVIKLINPAGANILGMSEEELIGKNFIPFIHEDTRHLLEGGFESLIAEKNRIALKIQHADGVCIDVELAARDYEMDDIVVNSTTIMLMARDVTEKNRTMQALAGREEHIRKIMDTIVDGIITIDQQGIIETINPAAEKIFGYSAGQLVGQNVSVITPIDIANVHDDYIAKYMSTGESQVVGSRREVEGRRKDGTAVSLDLALSKFSIGNRTVIIGAIRDITERKEQEERLLFMATRNPLTKLPNRNLFYERLGFAIDRIDRTGGQAAILFADLDHFKNINDTLGHVVGDHVIQEVGRRIGACLGDSDTVAHLAGDEFNIILDDIKSIDEVKLVTENILTSLSEVYHIDGKEIFSSASIGVVLYPDHGTTLAELMMNVDTAAHRAKVQDRGSYQIYNEQMSEQAKRRMQVETGLRRAIENNEFEILYQAKISLDTRIITGAEALLRWHSPELGMVSPVEFVPIAEETGLIISIGDWVLESACKEAMTWPETKDGPVTVGVNLSALQFLHGDLGARVAEILESTGLPADRLDLELTESMLVVNPERTIEILENLSAMGITISMDDFGTGYSSLSYLTRFPLHSLKVDRAFVTNLPNDSDAVGIAKAIVSMAQNLNLHIVAEGIETEGQVAFLHALGCQTGQGYLFSKPISLKDFMALIHDNDFTSK